MATGRRVRNPRRVLIPLLQELAREIRSCIGRWRPDSGLVRAARPGEEVYPERSPEEWAIVAHLGKWLVIKGEELRKFALEQKRLAENPSPLGDPYAGIPVVPLSKQQYEALDSADPAGSIRWVAGGTKHSLYKHGLVVQYAGQTDRWYIGVTSKGHAAMRAYEAKHPEVLQR